MPEMQSVYFQAFIDLPNALCLTSNV